METLAQIVEKGNERAMWQALLVPAGISAIRLPRWACALAGASNPPKEEVPLENVETSDDSLGEARAEDLQELGPNEDPDAAATSVEECLLEHPAVRDRLAAELRATTEAAQRQATLQPADFPPDTIERLRELGYVDDERP